MPSASHSDRFRDRGCRVETVELPGAQFLTFNENGLIAKFRDFVRPLPAVLALQEAAGEFIASQSAATSSERSDQHNIQHRRRHGKEYN